MNTINTGGRAGARAAGAAGAVLLAVLLGWLPPDVRVAAAKPPVPVPASDVPEPEAPESEAPSRDDAPPPVSPAADPGASGASQPAAPKPDDAEVIVYLKDGQRLTGMLVSSSTDELRVRIAGITTPFPMGLIEKYEVMPPINERYLELRKAVGDDPRQILQLAQWLRDRERYELALSEIERVLVLDPQTPGAKSLKLLLEQQILLKRRAAPKAGADDEEGEAEKAGPVPRSARFDFPLLSREQINLIKVYEVDLEVRPRLTIRRETVARLLEQNAGHPLVPITKEGREAWYRKDPIDLLGLMFSLQARNLYQEVEVIDQPRTFELFRENVHRTWLLNRCATNDCHGGLEAGRLVLYNRRPNSEATVYTNFLILDRLTLSNGVRLINVEEPGTSPLLQIGLPREDSLYPHPVVRGERGRDIWRPVFNATDDRMFVEAVEWLQTLYRPRPSYPMTYTPPHGAVRPEAAGAAPPKAPAPATPPRPTAPASPTPMNPEPGRPGNAEPAPLSKPAAPDAPGVPEPRPR